VKPIEAADLFAGAGGTSTGLLKAAESRERKVNLVALNHWETSVETHSYNHPSARHLCQSIDSVNPREAVPGGYLDLLVASPECIGHSNARGGRPTNEQGRATAWNVLNWCDALTVRSVLIENVPEFTQWGPLYPDDHPDKSLRGKSVPSEKGKFFKNFVRNLRCLGYAVDWKFLTCADFGDATTRRRLFLRADKGVRRVKYPEATHYPANGLSLTDQAWVPAKDIIDWSLRGKSIFARKTPLAAATLRRIEAGLRKYCGMPYVVIFRNGQDASSVDEPLKTLTTFGANFGLCTPFLIGAGGPTGSGRPAAIDAPLGTVLTDNHRALVQPFLIPYYGECEGQGARCLSVDDPLDTITTSNRFGLVQPFLVSYYGNGEALSIHDPLDTVTTKDRFGLVQPRVRGADGKEYLLDIEFRMLQPHELAAAHSFPAGYRFAGKRKDVVMQIGNSVPCKTAEALCGSIIDRWAA